MLTARRDSDPGAGAGGDHLLASPGAIWTGPYARGPCARKSMNPTFGVKLGPKRHNQSIVSRALLLLEMPSAAGMSQKVPKSRKLSL